MSDSPRSQGFDQTQEVELDQLVQVLKTSLRRVARVPVLHTNTAATILVLALAGWLLSGIYKVQPDEQGVVLRFGKWIATTGPGLHYRLPYPIDSVLFPKVTAINQVRLGESTLRITLPTGLTAEQQQQAAASAANVDELIGLDEHQALTSDENIVKVDCVVFWQIKDAGQFLFRVYNPEAAVRVAAESALREVIGQTPIQAALSEKRREIADQTRDLVQKWLDADHAGIVVTQVQLQRIDPPSAVFDAFNDVQRARADQERARNEAQAYANDIIPRARGDADRIVQDAEAYKTQVLNLADGEAKSFDSLLQSYESARDVTAWRLYMESVDAMLKKANKVILDSSGKGVQGVVPYLPLEEQKPAATADQKQRQATSTQGAKP